MKIPSLDLEEVKKRAGIKTVCEYTVACKDSSENARKDWTITIDGCTESGQKKRVFYNLTTWEEIVND